MNNLENLPNIYTPKDMANILTYGDGHCAFCAYRESCKTVLPDGSNCYEGIKEYFESEAITLQPRELLSRKYRAIESEVDDDT